MDRVVDTQTSKIIAASNWKLCLASYEAISKGCKEPPEWLEDEVKAEAEAAAKPVNEARAAANPHPFLYLNFCYTAVEYQRRGAGSMMMQWGNDLADILFLPCWVEASSDGTGLYKAFEYYEAGVIDLGAEEGHFVVAMRRDARTKGIEGGRLVSNGVRDAGTDDGVQRSMESISAL